MNIDTLEVSQEEAEAEWHKYVEAVKTRKEKYLEDLKQVYHALSHGKKVLDIYAVMKEHGVSEQSRPKLAIGVAGNRRCVFVKQASGAGVFRIPGLSASSSEVTLPGMTFPDWPRFTAAEDREAGLDTAIARHWETGQIKERELSTPMPIVPAHLLPDGKLGRYFILWEVAEWTVEQESPARPAQDPFLLRRINSNMFIVMAEWDLSPIEQAISKSLT